jgi:hypothetical protein
MKTILLIFFSMRSLNLKTWMVDPCIVIDKMMVNEGGVRKSYLGPPESLPNQK